MTDHNINEALSTAAEPNVATTDENLSVAQMFQQSTPTSLARQILPVVPMTGPTAALFFPKRNAAGDLEILRADVECYPNPRIKTGVTDEVIQDIRNQFGREADDMIGKLLRGAADEDENDNFFTFLDTEAKLESAVTLSAKDNAETILFELGLVIAQKVQAANTPFHRTYSSFAIIPWDLAAAFAALSDYVGESDDARGLYVADLGTTRIFVNPDTQNTNVYVGLTSSDATRSSAVFTPYVSDVVRVVDPNDGSSKYDIYNRYAITGSALHTPTEPMLFKFAVS